MNFNKIIFKIHQIFDVILFLLEKFFQAKFLFNYHLSMYFPCIHYNFIVFPSF